MIFKKTQPSLKEIILLSQLSHASRAGMVDFGSVIELVLSRLEPGQITHNQLLELNVMHAVELYNEACDSIPNPDNSHREPASAPTNNQRDEVALTPVERERLSKLMAYMRERKVQDGD